MVAEWHEHPGEPGAGMGGLAGAQVQKQAT